MKLQKFTLLFVCLLSAWSLRAQELSEHKSLSIGLDLGLNASYTDIAQYPLFPTLENRPSVQYSIHGHIKKSLSPVFGIQLNAGFDRIQGTLRASGGDSQAQQMQRLAKLNRWGFDRRMIWFNTIMLNAGLDLHVNLSNIDIKYRANKERKFLWYLIAGFDVTSYNPDILRTSNREYGRSYINRVVNKQGKGVRGNVDPSHTILLHGGAGVKYNLNSKFDIGAELILNYGTTDLLDGLEVSSPLNDAFVVGQITLNYKLPSKTAGPEADLIDWANPGEEILSDINDLNARVDSLGNMVNSAIANADSDGDGVIDSQDKEPYTPYGAEVDADGRGKDSDGDGVYDGLDQEPNTPAGKLVNFQGKEIKQTMGDPGTGTPTVGLPGGIPDGEAGAYFPSLFFDTASTRIRSVDIDKLVRVATLMANNPAMKVTLVGHADIRGGTEFNEKLAGNRANAVRDYLVNNLGAKADRITVESKGESQPLSPTLNNVNRRVDIIGTLK